LRSSVERIEFTLSCIAFTWAHVIGALGGLLGLGVVSSFDGATSMFLTLFDIVSCLYDHACLI
jgi:hypothetical protein